jgi:hypothetical protein
MKLFLLGLVCFFLVGCVNVRFISKDGTTVEYTRFMTNVGSIKGNVGDNSIEVGNSTISVEALNAAIGVLKTVSK